MKDIYKNPILYYILVPLLVALWPLLVGSVYLPESRKTLKDEISQYEDAKKIIGKILELDRERLEFAPQKASGEFDYAVAIVKIASLCEIPTANYNISSSPIRTPGGQKIRDAQVALKDVEITKFAKFLSTIQLRWGSLQCEKVTLTKSKGVPDTWKVDLNFRYYY